MKTKITVVGIGGVGGYYGAMLARKYKTSESVDVCFLVRGENLKRIQVAGLARVEEEKIFISYPHLATDDPAEIGVSDYVIIATKGYDLETTLEQIKPLVGKNTVIVPLLNGINNLARIRIHFPETMIWGACTYIVAHLEKPGMVKVVGSTQLLYFGAESSKKENRRELSFEKILKDAGIDVRYSLDIQSVIWRKFFFISIAASLTSYFDVGFSDLLAEERKELFAALVKELILVAEAEKITLADDILDELLCQLSRLPKGPTSSMHNDFKAKRKTELESLTGIVVELAKKHDIELPNYTMVYEALKERESK